MLPLRPEANLTCSGLVGSAIEDTRQLLQPESLALGHVHKVREDLDRTQTTNSTASTSCDNEDIHGQCLDWHRVLAVQDQIDVLSYTSSLWNCVN